MTLASFMEVVLLTVFSSLDNFSIGVTFALNKKIFPTNANLLISSMNAAVTFSTMIFGDVVLTIIQPKIAESIGAAIFSTLGCIELYKFYTAKNLVICSTDCTMKLKKIDDVVASSSSSREVTVSLSETLTVGLGLCATNVAGGNLYSYYDQL